MIRRSTISWRGIVLRNAWRTASAVASSPPYAAGSNGPPLFDGQVDVLVRRPVTGDDLDAAIGERLELGEQVARRLRLDHVDLFVLHRLHRSRRVTDDAVDDRLELRLRAPRVVLAGFERQLGPLGVPVRL